MELVALPPTMFRLHSYGPPGLELFRKVSRNLFVQFLIAVHKYKLLNSFVSSC
jgi:hypothetical protein